MKAPHYCHIVMVTGVFIILRASTMESVSMLKQPHVIWCHDEKYQRQLLIINDLSDGHRCVIPALVFIFTGGIRKSWGGNPSWIDVVWTQLSTSSMKTCYTKIIHEIKIFQQDQIIFYQVNFLHFIFMSYNYRSMYTNRVTTKTTPHIINTLK